MSIRDLSKKYKQILQTPKILFNLLWAPNHLDLVAHDIQQLHSTHNTAAYTSGYICFLSTILNIVMLDKYK